MAVRSRPGKPVGLRVPPEALMQIDARAAERGMNRTEYMLAASLGELRGIDISEAERLDSAIERIERIERALFET